MSLRSMIPVAPCVLLLAAASCRRGAAPEAPLKVAAAADLALAFKEAGEAFAKKGHAVPTFSFGSTGLLEKQIEQGAPYDVFAAANVSFADAAVKAGACDGSTRTLYARGRIVMFAAADGGAPVNLADLASPRYVRIAIANPEHAPYGKAAQEALTSVGVWDAVKPRLVFGENAQQTLQFAQTGNAEVAIVPLSLSVVTKGASQPIDAALHRPIDQALVVCAKTPKRAEEARAFTTFLAAPEGRAILRRYGFLLPSEATASP